MPRRGETADPAVIEQAVWVREEVGRTLAELGAPFAPNSRPSPGERALAVARNVVAVGGLRTLDPDTGAGAWCPIARILRARTGVEDLIVGHWNVSWADLRNPRRVAKKELPASIRHFVTHFDAGAIRVLDYEVVLVTDVVVDEPPVEGAGDDGE